MLQDYTRRDPEKPGREPRRDDDPDRRPDPSRDEPEREPMEAREPDLEQETEDDPDDGLVDDQREHPAVEEERRRLRRDGVYI